MAAHTITTPSKRSAVNNKTRSPGGRQVSPADVEVIPSVPPEPPQTPEEEAASRDQLRRMQALVAQLRQRNLNNAVLLAEQAAAGHGPLVDHFCELGRRFGHELRAAPKSRFALKVIDGGAA